jgi:sugar lactone lactonase YvrE
VAGMSRTDHLKVIVAIAAFSGLAAEAAHRIAQGTAQPTNDLPNPYQTVEQYFKLPDGRTWGSTSAVDIDKDGRSVWVAERCGANSCLNSPTVDTILKFDASGKLVKSFGAGMLIFPHGIFVDRAGNVWVTDGQDDAPRPQRGAAAGGPPAAPAPAGPIGPPAAATRGNQVYEFSPDGTLLLTLGKKGGAAEPGYFYQPNDVLTAPNGDIFVAEGHGAGNNRLYKFSKDGTLIKAWGKKGTGPNEFDQPHALAMDSKGRLFVGDRNNNRIQILDQDGKFLEEWKQFSRPSGIYIDAQDTIYVADSESEVVARNHDGWKRGIRVGSARDGSVKYLIPDPAEHPTTTSAAEGVAVDAQGNIYGAEVGPKAVKRYVRK